MTPKKQHGQHSTPKLATHLYVHPHSPEAWLVAKLAQMQELQSILPRLELALKIRNRFWAGEERLILEQCPVCKSTAHRDDPQRYPVYRRTPSNDFYCEPGKHAISMRQLIEATVGAENLERFLRALHPNSDLPLNRFFVYETSAAEGEAQRAVGTDPHQTLAQLDLRDAKTPVRGVVIEAPNLELATQLAGQPASRKTLPWCEHVPLHRDGSLADVRWHGGYLTERERLLLHEQNDRDHRERRRRQQRELQDFLAENQNCD